MKEEIKKELYKIIGKKIKIIVDVGRNKREEYEGYIEKLYKNIWTFKTNFDLKSFSYCDILTKQVIIIQ